MGVACKLFAVVNLMVIVTNIQRINGGPLFLLPDAVNQSQAVIACNAQGLKISDPKTMESWWHLTKFLNEVEDG